MPGALREAVGQPQATALGDPAPRLHPTPRLQSLPAAACRNTVRVLSTWEPGGLHGAGLGCFPRASGVSPHQPTRPDVDAACFPSTHCGPDC
ncbi:unspecified product [Leishmania tarentolae]|uniref:Unspecified product n=1 Tax=Leishmania tarentolae TaxID=5689 RepID=A0A640KPB5_LEITA|nr:unspecified product [Leishmania tarentolae]